jgi:hypothetical protein
MTMTPKDHRNTEDIALCPQLLSGTGLKEPSLRVTSWVGWGDLLCGPEQVFPITECGGGGKCKDFPDFLDKNFLKTNSQAHPRITKSASL